MFVIIVSFFLQFYISQGSVETHLQCGEIYNNHIIASSPQSAPVKKFGKSANKWQSMDKSIVARFYKPQCSA